MGIEQTLRTIAGHLRSGHLGNEAQVKQSVIVPVLRALDWDDTDPEVLKPEYSAGRGLVDYALLDSGRPLIFIEAKRIGYVDAGGEEQLFGYASNRGIPLLVLTDGNRWDFYLSMAEGIPAERRFYRLELQLERKIPEYIDFLREHLRRDRVVSGQARISAEKRHASNRERARARRVIPSVWRTLLNEPDETLRDLLAETVESECGTKPELEDVETFLRNLPSLSPLPEPDPRQPPHDPKPLHPQPDPKRPSEPQPTRTRIVGFSLRDKHVETGTAIGTLAKLLTEFGREDPAFMERFSLKTVSKSRRLVAKNRAELYEKQHLVKSHATRLENGWWLGTNLSQERVRGHVATACSVAGVELNAELRLIER